MSELWNDVKASVKLLLLYCFAFALCCYSGYEMYREGGTKVTVTDPHAILFGVGLLCFPFFPRVFAAAVQQVGKACAEAWKSRNSA
jgi:hypothetical protein